MKYLMKKSSDENVLIDRICNSALDLKDAYYILLDNLNALYDNYPDEYNKLKLLVKLPNERLSDYINTLITDLENSKSDF